MPRSPVPPRASVPAAASARRSSTPSPRPLVVPVLALVLALAAIPGLTAPAPAAAQAELRTAAEASGFERHTRHDEMWEYLEALREASPEMRLGVYGETWEGRRLPYAIFSRPLVTQPWEAWALDRPVLVLAANVHGNERTLRESLLLLMRDFATPGTEAYELLDELVVVAAPQINPDGFEASERGTRGNVRGIDLNRDYVKLEHPEVASYVGNILQEWQPHLFVDGHNGGSYPYNLNYQCPSHADADPAITAMCDDEIFPAIDARLASEDYLSFFYSRGDEEEWRVGGNQARIGRNYGGFVNMAGILFESPGGQEMATAVRAGYLGYLAVVEWAAANPGPLVETVRAARVETVRRGLEADGEVVVEMEYAAEEEPVSYLITRRPDDIGEDEEITREDLEIVEVTDGRLMKRPVALKTRPLPYAYVLPPEAREAVDMLRRHDITVEVLQEEMEIPVDVYTLAGVSYERAYDHAAATVVEVGEVLTLERELRAGSFVVPTGQMLGRLVGHMLEPESSDNVVYWNTMDAWLPKPRLGEELEEGETPPLIPIYKIMEPRALPTRMLRSGG